MSYAQNQSLISPFPFRMRNLPFPSFMPLPLNSVKHNSNNLPMDRDLILKRLLIKLTLEKELESVTKQQFSSAEQTLLFYALHRIVLQFPPFAHHIKANSKKYEGRNLMKFYSRLVSLCRSATKHDIAGFRHLSSVMDMLIEIPEETKAKNVPELQTEVRTVRNVLQEEFIGGTIMEMISDVLKYAKTNGNGSASGLIATVQNTEYEDLPPEIKKLFGFIHEHWAPKLLVQTLDTPSKLAKWKTVYHLTPRRGIRTVLKLVHTSSLINGLLNLFLAKPFGSRNLLQRLFTEGTDLNRTEKNLKRMSKQFPKKIAEKVHRWIDAYYTASPFSNPLVIPLIGEPDLDADEEWKNKGITNPHQYIARILESTIAPILPHYEIETWLTNEHFAAIQQLVILEMRKKDKEECIELFGDREVIAILKEVLPVIYEPVFDVYAYGDLPVLVDDFFHLLKTLIVIAEEEHINIGALNEAMQRSINSERPEVTLEQYNLEMVNIKLKAKEQHSKALEQFEKGFYNSFRKIAKSHKGPLLEEVLNWGFGLLDTPTVSFDPQSVLSNLEEKERQEVMTELDSVIEFKKLVSELRERAQVTGEKQVRPKRPKLHAITDYLVPLFRSKFVKSNFSAEIDVL